MGALPARVTPANFVQEADRIIDRVAESLFAADVTLRRLDAHVAEQKLNLVELSSGLVA
jgi:hypothetical protein